MTLRDKIFSFDGRLRRQDYWLISLGLGLSVFLLTELAILMIFGQTQSLFGGGFVAFQERANNSQALFVQNLVGFVTLWPALAMSAKRAHDRNKSARLIISLLLGTFVASYAPAWLWMTYPVEMASPPGVAGFLVFSVVSFVISIYIFVVVGCLDGTPGPNRFGASPKGLGGEPADTAADVVS